MIKAIEINIKKIRDENDKKFLALSNSFVKIQNKINRIEKSVRNEEIVNEVVDTDGQLLVIQLR